MIITQILILSFFMALILTALQIKLSPFLKLYDVPKDERRMHKKAMPTCGGISIFLASMLPFLIFAGFSLKNIYIAIASFIIVISGFIDDRYNLKPYQKVIMQIVAGLILIFFADVRIVNIGNPFKEDSLINLGILSVPISLFWIVGVTNIINLIDGLDGLASGVSVISSLTLAFIAYKLGYISMVLLSLALAFAQSGFLIYNFPPAKIFMGDTGALYSGFLLSIITINGVMKSVAMIGVIVPIIILGIPIFDTTFAMIRRILSGRSIASADKGHLHHRLIRRYSTKKTIIILYTVSLIFSFFAVLISLMNNTSSVIIAMLLLIFIVFIACRSGFFKNEEDKKEN